MAILLKLWRDRETVNITQNVHNRRESKFRYVLWARTICLLVVTVIRSVIYVGWLWLCCCQGIRTV